MKIVSYGYCRSREIPVKVFRLIYRAACKFFRELGLYEVRVRDYISLILPIISALLRCPQRAVITMSDLGCDKGWLVNVLSRYFNIIGIVF